MEKKKDEENSFSRWNALSILVAFSVLAVFLVSPSPSGISHEGWLMIGILLMAIILWITTPIPISVTRFIIMKLPPRDRA